MTEAVSQKSSDIRVVFSRESGRILHIHHSFAAPGVELPADHVLRAAALDMALKNSGEANSESAEKLDVLSVSGDDLKPDTRYKVDLQQRCVVSEKHDGE